MDLSQYIDHTALGPSTSENDVDRLCDEALRFGFHAICIPPHHIRFAAQRLADTDIKIVTVAGFPYGYSATPAKVEEIKRALEEGAHELDVVVNLAAVRSGQWNYVEADIDRMVTAVHLKGKAVKIIVETGLSTPAELDKLCAICNKQGVDYVKTSTGVNGDGVSVEAVRYLRGKLKKGIKIKASGGIRDAAFARELIQAGADRLGTSSGPKLVR
ncbi:MAG: deoxyribose-phosphate aldolase [Saprospiraceae bacterium]